MGAHWEPTGSPLGVNGKYKPTDPPTVWRPMRTKQEDAAPDIKTRIVIGAHLTFFKNTAHNGADACCATSQNNLRFFNSQLRTVQVTATMNMSLLALHIARKELDE